MSPARPGRRGWRRSVRDGASLILLAGLLHGVGAAAARAQAPIEHGAGGPRSLSDAARISLVTVLPGDRVYSLFGHNAIRVVDPVLGIDTAYNYGTFTFGNPVAFAARFAYGDLNYRLDTAPYRPWTQYYLSREGRPIVEQVLNLDAETIEDVYRFLEWNALPENAYYRYDFYFDNCATRIRDVLEQALGERLVPAEDDPHASLRQLLDPYLAGRPWLHFAMDAGQGRPADIAATWRSALFLPDQLAEWVADSRLRTEDGLQPLVAATDSIGWNETDVLPASGGNGPAIVVAAFLGLVVWLTALDLRGRTPGRAWFDRPVFLVLGGAGLLILFLWFVSLHEVTRANLNLLWALPTGLVLAGLGRRSAGNRARFFLLALTAASAGIFALGWPFWTQELPLATLPLSLAVAFRSAGLAFLEWSRKTAG